MARVTVEGCVEKVRNRFELVLFSAHRARVISAGAEILVERDNDKNPVIALREIEEAQLEPKDIREDVISTLQKRVEVDEPEEGRGFRREARRPAIGMAEAPAPAPESDMAAMSEDDILNALRAMEDAAPKDDNDGGRGDVSE